MKKLALLFAAAAMVASASAQEQGLRQSKFWDNWYVGINGGVATKTTGHSWLKDLDPNAGLRIGKNITPVFGLAIEGNAYFSNKPWKSTGTVVRGINTQLLGTVNLSNLFCGYNGDPRTFEVTALYGMGWGHLFTASYTKNEFGEVYEPTNRMTSKVAVDLQFNLGKNKEWQIYVEPSINYAFLGQAKLRSEQDGKIYGAQYGYKAYSNGDQGAYNIHNSFFQLNAGVVYKFKNHDGRHNFTLVDLRDQAEIDALNDQINGLKAELAKKPKEVIKEVVKEVPAKVKDNVVVSFAQGKSELTSDAKAALDQIAEGSNVEVVGLASPEGSKELNDKLSQERADVVASYLKSKGVNVNDATGKGVQGAASNRLAIVYVK